MSSTAELPRRPLGRYSYPTSHRVIELVSVAVWFVLAVLLARDVVGEVAERLSLVVVAGLLLAAGLAFVAADVASGIVHALCDNIGSEQTPIVGQKFIRSFREHHADPLDMTRGDFVRVNADNFLASLLVLGPTVLWLEVSDHLYAATFVLVLCLLVVVTNQIHKWAHLATTGEPVPAVVRRLQAWGVILSPEHHQVHHTPPHDGNYCITSGIANGPLARLGLWRLLFRGA